MATTVSEVVIFGFRAEEDLIHFGTLVRMEKGDKIWMKMFRTTPFRAAIAEFCKRNAIDEASLAFFLGNREIFPTDTPAKVNMKPTSEIISVQHKKETLQASTFFQDFKSLYKSDRLSDVVLKVKDTSFPCHRVVLAARCPKFAAMFGVGGSDVALRERTQDVIEVECNSPPNFSMLLEYLYTDNVTALTSENALDLLCLADEYIVARLKQMCEMRLIEIVDTENVGTLLCHANHYNAHTLKQHCITFSLDNSQEVFNSENFVADLRSPELLHELLRATSKRFPEASQEQRGAAAGKKRKRDSAPST